MPECVIFNTKINIEIPLFLLFFVFSFSDSIRTNLIVYRTCYITLGQNKSECALLGTDTKDNSTAELEKLVEPHAAIINMVYSLSQSCFSALACLFVGPWSDRFGRRPFLIVPVIGVTLCYVMYIIFAIVEISPWYSILCLIPVYLTGGGTSYLTIILSYLTDTTNENNRGVRMGIFEAILSLGIFIGNISSSFVYNATNYYTIFMISASCCFAGLIFTYFFIPESVVNAEVEGRFKNLFSLGNVSDMLKTTFKPRATNQRFIILSCVVSLAIYILLITGDGALTFLYLREKFGWSLQEYTLYSAAHNVAWVLGTALGVYLLHKFLGIPEQIMMVIGFASMCMGMTFMGLAKKKWQVYGAAFVRCLGGVLSPMVRSLVSKMLPGEEVGKVFAVIVIGESLLGMGGGPLFTAIYNSTIDFDPGIYNFVEAAVYLLEIAISGYIVYAKLDVENYARYESIDEESEDLSQ